MQIKEQWKGSKNWKLVTGAATAATLSLGALAVAVPGEADDTPPSIHLDGAGSVEMSASAPGGFVPFELSGDVALDVPETAPGAGERSEPGPAHHLGAEPATTSTAPPATAGTAAGTTGPPPTEGTAAVTTPTSTSTTTTSTMSAPTTTTTTTTTTAPATTTSTTTTSTTTTSTTTTNPGAGNPGRGADDSVDRSPGSGPSVSVPDVSVDLDDTIDISIGSPDSDDSDDSDDSPDRS